MGIDKRRVRVGWKPDPSNPMFTPVAPPTAWDVQMDVTGTRRFTGTFGKRLSIEARPVPRRASAHYHNHELTSGGGTVYFY